MAGTTELPEAPPESFRLVLMHHPSHHVPDLDEAERWFERVFHRSSTSIGNVLSRLTVRSDWPLDYSIYTPISDVFFDSIDPKRFVISGDQRYANIEKPHLKDFGFSVDGMTGAYRALKRHGISVTNTLGELAEGDEPPKGPNDPAPFSTLRQETGLRYKFYPAGPFPCDPRTAPDWVLPAVADDDPLGIVCCSHHTVLTSRPERAVELFAEILGGDVVHQGRDELRRLTSTYIHVGGSTLEYAVPDADTAVYEEWSENDPEDTYHAITWNVVDLDRAERHLQAQGVKISARSDDTIVTDPDTSLGIPWGFSTSFVPGDPRARL
jgi:catechol 2,3-dioxygenase-like lactoylglutathione lyase family enzyme